MPKDVVCDRHIETEDSRYFSEYGPDTFYFCSPECKRKFDDHPDREITGARARAEKG